MKEGILESFHYCGCVNDKVEINEKKQCLKCNKKAVEWHHRIYKKDEIHSAWLEANKPWWNRILKSEKSAYNMIFIGLVISLVFVVIFIINHPLSFNTSVDEEALTKLAESISGITGSIWALAGVILFYLALKNQLKNSNTNVHLLMIQASFLENQLEEFKESIEQTKKIVKTNEETFNSMEKQISLMEENLEQDKFVQLINAYSNLAKIEEDIPTKFELQMKAKKYLTDYTNKVNE